MVKLNIPAQVKVEFKPFELVPSDDHYERMSRVEWRMCVADARDQVMQALNRFSYDNDGVNE